MSFLLCLSAERAFYNHSFMAFWLSQICAHFFPVSGKTFFTSSLSSTCLHIHVIIIVFFSLSSFWKHFKTTQHFFWPPFICRRTENGESKKCFLKNIEKLVAKAVLLAGKSGEISLTVLAFSHPSIFICADLSAYFLSARTHTIRSPAPVPLKPFWVCQKDTFSLHPVQSFSFAPLPLFLSSSFLLAIFL